MNYNMFRSTHDEILNELSKGELSWPEIAKKYKVSMSDIQVVFDEYMDNLHEYYS